MKTNPTKTLFILIGLVFAGSGTLSAGVVDDFKRFVGTELSSLEAFYLMAGIIIGSVVLYIMTSYFDNQEEEKAIKHRVHYNHHHRRHHHRPVKKTS
jgi:hypothetical protein